MPTAQMAGCAIIGKRQERVPWFWEGWHRQQTPVAQLGVSTLKACWLPESTPGDLNTFSSPCDDLSRTKVTMWKEAPATPVPFSKLSLDLLKLQTNCVALRD